VIEFLKNRSYNDKNYQLAIELLTETGRVDPLNQMILQFLKDKFLTKSHAYITDEKDFKELAHDRNDKTSLQDLRRQVESCRSNAELRQRSLNFNF
jgi:hypothetical protein